VTVLSDSSPLITLAKIGHLDLLPQLYETVTITPEVYAEVVVSGAGLAGAFQISAAKWIRVKSVQKQANLAAAQQRWGLGIGELSIIMLGQELQADILLIDDMKARKVAREEGLTVLGCVGVLHDAFGLKLVPDLPATLPPITGFRRLRRSADAAKYSEDSQPSPSVNIFDRGARRAAAAASST
jgi:predicted nucleic acid-binding protein